MIKYINDSIITLSMATEAIQQTDKVKTKKDDVDWELVEGFRKSLEDIKQGRIRRVR